MSLLPSTLLNSSTNEDQTLEVHSEILEPLAHSQTMTRWEIPHKNILDSDSVLIWKVYWDKMTGGTAPHNQDGSMFALPLVEAGLYDSIKRARLFCNGKIISELNEVGKYLTMRNNFAPHEVKVEVLDYFSYADHDIVNSSGQIKGKNRRIQSTPGDKSIGNSANFYEVEASVKLHQLFSVLKDAQLDTNAIHGKIMIEIDWNSGTADGKNNNVIYTGSAPAGGDKGISVQEPRLILDFLTYNDEVQAQIRETIFGDGPGVSMPYREVALVRKPYVGTATASEKDYAIGMTGRAVQKIWVQKVATTTNNDVNNLMGECRSDLFEGQVWNCRVNDLMIFDRNVDNRAEEFNYFQQAGETQATMPPGTYERRNAGVAEVVNYTANDNIWAANQNLINFNDTPANAISKGNLPEQRQGRQNYLAVPLSKYNKGGESVLNAMRIGSTPIIFTLKTNGANDADTTAKDGNLYFFVEYLKMMNLKNGDITIMDM